MNIERNVLMFLVATPETFADYGVHEQGTKLQSGKVFIHASKCGNMAIRFSGDKRVQGYDVEGFNDYLEYFDGYAGSEENEV